MQKINMILLAASMMATLCLGLKEFKDYDTHESITSEEIWDENLALHAGVGNLTAEIYTE